jgi:cobalamin synthase
MDLLIHRWLVLAGQERISVMRDSRPVPLGNRHLHRRQVPCSGSDFDSSVLILLFYWLSWTTIYGFSCCRSACQIEGGLAKPFIENLGHREMALSLVSTFGITLLLMGVKGIVLFFGIGLFSLGYRFFFIKKLGGVTGDILGAANELTELLSLILLVILEPIQ